MSYKKILLKIIFALIVFVGVFALYRCISFDPYVKRSEWTHISLKIIRDNVNKFHTIHGKYPDSVTALNEYINNNSEEEFYGKERENKEYISSESGLDNEYNVLNGQGGWYYNKNNGEVRVNIVKPLKKCFEPYYYLPARNKIPSDW